MDRTEAIKIAQELLHQNFWTFDMYGPAVDQLATALQRAFEEGRRQGHNAALSWVNEKVCG